jgi:hypothetical protein
LIIPLKKDYADPKKLNDINHDSLMLMAMNISANYNKYNKKPMSEKEVSACIEMFIDFMNAENNLDTKWRKVK